MTMRKLITICVLLIALAAAPVLSSPVSNRVAPPTAVQKGKPDARVWVNTGSGVYHCPGTRWYGKTKKGEYMTQKEAQDKGYRPAYGKYCE
jgi:hypothetical protein